MNPSEDKEVIVRSLTRAVSYKGLNLRHFTVDLISKLVHAGKLETVADIFNLALSDLIKYGGKEVADKILANPPNKMTSLPNFIYALGLCFDNKDYQHKLALKFRTLENFLNAPYKEIESVVGIELAITISNAMVVKRRVATKLEQLGFYVPVFNKKHFNGMFEEKEFVLSGRFETHRHIDIVAIITQAGGTWTHTVRESTGYLFAGQADTKTMKIRMKKARELNVPIIDQYQLKRLFRLYGVK